MKFSLIAPTFGRPEEVIEFLESLLKQKYGPFEVIIADGTPKDTLRPAIEKFKSNNVYELKIIYEEFLPVSDARNAAAREAKGDYFIFLDSDCIIPPDYLNHIDLFLNQNKVDLFGGPDAASDDFTGLQKAISFSMTSFLTTGGIRGKEKVVGTYHPRGFNMGISRKAFETVNGYDENFRCGEDIELSMRIIEAGFISAFIPKAHVYHKRRTSLKKFFFQVYRFGAARVNIWKRHPKELKITHLFPLAFASYSLFAVLCSVMAYFSSGWLMIALFALSAPFYLYLVLVFLSSSFQDKFQPIGFLSIATTLTMMFGYGWGFLRNLYAYQILKKPHGLKL